MQRHERPDPQYSAWPFTASAMWPTPMPPAGARTRTWRSCRSAVADPASAQQLADKFGLHCAIHHSFEDVLRDPRVDIVNLSGPNHVHAAQAIAAAESGRHVLVEKPMVFTMADNRALRDAVAKAGVKSIVSFVLRWNPDDREPEERCWPSRRSATCSTPKSTTGTTWAPPIAAGTGPPAKTPGAAPCCSAAAMPWMRCAGWYSRMWSKSRPWPITSGACYEYDANVVAIVKFRNGALGKTSVLFDAKIPYTFNVDLLGTEGSLRDNRLWMPQTAPRPEPVDDVSHDHARLGRRAPPSVRRPDRPLRGLHSPRRRVALQRGRLLPHPRAVSGHRPVGRGRRTGRCGCRCEPAQNDAA